MKGINHVEYGIQPHIHIGRTIGHLNSMSHNHKDYEKAFHYVECNISSRTHRFIKDNSLSIL